MRTRAMLAACVAVLTATGAGAADAAPPPRAVDDIWLPRSKARGPSGEDAPLDDAPRSAFPSLGFVPPRWEVGDSFGSHRERFEEAWQTATPRLLGQLPVAINAADGPPQRLLRARLQQAIREHRLHSTPIAMPGPGRLFTPPFECLADVRAAVLELHAGRPKDLAPWLEELVIATKEEERYTRLRVEAGASEPHYLNYATRHRLRAETDLWKMLNAEARPAQAPPAKAVGAKGPPAGGDWLDDKKPPPSLFPEVVLPPPPKGAGGWHSLDTVRSWLRVAAVCPRLSGAPGLKIEAGDGTPRRLLKARLHQGALELYRLRLAESSQSPRWENSARYDCTDDVLAVAVELFARQPDELAHWLEELLIDAKEWERHLWLRLEAGAVRPSEARQASRHRLKVEAELWKAKNPK